MNPNIIVDEALVSIIMPSYNSEKIIADSINSIRNQIYQNWELLIVDDCSNDTTTTIIQDLMKLDSRIKLRVLEINSGAAVARNTAIKSAKGKYLAFLDSDDLWKKDKLTKQITFMEVNNYTFTSTSFEEIDEENKLNSRIIKSYSKLDYNGVLKNCPGNSTVIYDVEKLGKFYATDIRKRNDFVMWLQVIKKAKYLYGMDEVLTSYRIREGSLSKNKFDLVKYQWKVYREIEKIPVLKSFYLLIHKTLQIVKKKILTRTGRRNYGSNF